MRVFARYHRDARRTDSRLIRRWRGLPVDLEAAWREMLKELGQSEERYPMEDFLLVVASEVRPLGAREVERLLAYPATADALAQNLRLSGKGARRVEEWCVSDSPVSERRYAVQALSELQEKRQEKGPPLSPESYQWLLRLCLEGSAWEATEERAFQTLCSSPHVQERDLVRLAEHFARLPRLPYWDAERLLRHPRGGTALRRQLIRTAEEGKVTGSLWKELACEPTVRTIPGFWKRFHEESRMPVPHDMLARLVSADDFPTIWLDFAERHGAYEVLEPILVHLRELSRVLEGRGGAKAWREILSTKDSEVIWKVMHWADGDYFRDAFRRLAELDAKKALDRLEQDARWGEGVVKLSPQDLAPLLASGEAEIRMRAMRALSLLPAAPQAESEQVASRESSSKTSPRR